MIQQSYFWVPNQKNEISILKRYLHYMFIAALFIIPKTWKQPKYPPIRELEKYMYIPPMRYR